MHYLPLDNEIGNIPKDTSHMTCPDGWLALKSTADGDMAMDRSLALALKLNTSLGFLNSDIVASGWYLPYIIKSMNVLLEGLERKTIKSFLFFCFICILGYTPLPSVF